MTTTIDIKRRRVLAGLAAGAAALAFDPLARGWVTEAHGHGRASYPVPRLDGELLVDPAALAEAADDFGHIVHHPPVAVLRPGSIEDVRRIVLYANDHHLTVGARGRGHSASGQAQAKGGVVVDLSTLATIHAVTPHAVVVDAGVRWAEIVRRTLPEGLLPPVLPDDLDHTVGGSLAVGGAGDGSHRHGLAADNVLELEVVTGGGRRVICSASRHADLFDAALGGLGQHAIIVRATLPLVPARPKVRVYTVFYDQLSSFLGALKSMAFGDHFDAVRGSLVSGAGGTWRFMVEGVVQHAPGAPPDDEAILGSFERSDLVTSVAERDHAEWAGRFAAASAHFEQAELWGSPHPRLDLFLPDHAAEAFLAGIVREVDPGESYDYPVVLSPLRTDRVRRSLVALPGSASCFAFGMVRFATPDTVDAMLAEDRARFEEARDLGAKSQATGALSHTSADWVEHFGGAYASLLHRKATFDPRGVLAPGHGIFSRPAR